MNARNTKGSTSAWLSGLNAEQRQAVEHTDGPLLVLAGAGSGKTKTLVHRCVHLVRGRKVDPSRILVVTFTNKAANEMRERVTAFAGEDAEKMVVSTFHSLGARILRLHAEKLGLPKRFAIYSGSDQIGALRRATEEIHIDDDRFDLKRVMRRISEWKTRSIDPVAAAREVADAIATGTRADDYEVLAADAYARYEETLRACGAVDFDDLLLLPVRLLENDDEVRRDVWRRWHYVMVDEYQDTNGVQLHMTRLLAGARRNVCVVGDDDQSIYAFRGADVGNILAFDRHFENAAIVKLEQNYRSTQRILDAANAVIAGNAHRHEKRLRTDNAVGDLIDVYEHADDNAEAELVASALSLRHFRERRPWREFAVLYRANTQSRPLEEALRGKGIPYRVIGGTAFFDRKEVADGMAYLRAVAHPHDEIALRRIINYPTRGIGRTSINRIADVARERGIGFARALRDDALVSAELGRAQAEAVASFFGELERHRHALETAERAAKRPPPANGLPPIAHWALQLFRDVGLEDAIRAEHAAGAADARLSNLRDVAGTIARYERRRWTELAERTAEKLPDDVDSLDAFDNDPLAEAWRPPSLHEALARLALTDPDEDEEDGESDVVTLMTMHGAKGLEFDDVFIVGLEEGLLPHVRSIEDGGAGLDEERRLLYVGITRARKKLSLSMCRARRKGGEMVDVLPSRYLAEIPEALVDRKSAGRLLSPEESATLKRDFFANMRALLAEG
ncbi:MAG TPA: UvrD-helicase domain-containing protein [Longimicrobiales bacterium]